MNELSIIIPCTRSIEALPAFIDKLAHFIMANPTDIDVIIVTNEDPVFTSGIVKSIKQKYSWLKFDVLQRKGLSRNFGALVRFGIAYSSSRYAVLVSPYDEDDLTVINKMLDKARMGHQVIQASRYNAGDEAKNVGVKFLMYQKIYRSLIKTLLNFDISDSTYGFKMFDRVFVQTIGLTQNGYSICSEITLKSLLADGRVAYAQSDLKIERKNTDFRLYKEGWGYFYLLIRGFLHRNGILWF